MRAMGRVSAALVLLVMVIGAYAPASAQTGEARSSGNVVFLHPDGSALNSWNAARTYWCGVDSALAWDALPFMAVYRGHSLDSVGASSNAGATAHAFGYRVGVAGSFGRDGAGDQARPILARSGYAGSVLREAAQAGHPTGVVNDGDLPEPGTGCFFAEVDSRDDALEIARQLIDGREGYEAVDRPLMVALGGGERFFLPVDLPPCGDVLSLECVAHTDPVDGKTAARTDGRNLLRDAVNRGWSVLRTRSEFDAFCDEMRADPDYAPRVLGLFAADDLFNDAPEEVLIAKGLVRTAAAEDPREGRLLLYGSPVGTHGFDPPSAAEMHELALELLARHARRVQKPFLLVTEVESTDNFANQNNAIGTLVALRRADAVIETSQEFLARDPRTLVLIAADSDASGMQLLQDAPPSIGVNPTGRAEEVQRVIADGIEGRNSAAFVAAPDANGATRSFTVGWMGTPDAHGGILARAAGLHADRLQSRYSARFGNVDVYAMMWETLFGKELGVAAASVAPSRPRSRSDRRRGVTHPSRRHPATSTKATSVSVNGSTSGSRARSSS